MPQSPDRRCVVSREEAIIMELKAVFLALQVFAPQMKHAHILIRIDNTTAIAYVNKMGGAHTLGDFQTWQFRYGTGV